MEARASRANSYLILSKAIISWILQVRKSSEEQHHFSMGARCLEERLVHELVSRSDQKELQKDLDLFHGQLISVAELELLSFCRLQAFNRLSKFKWLHELLTGFMYPAFYAVQIHQHQRFSEYSVKSGLCSGFGATSQNVAGLTSSKSLQSQQTWNHMGCGSIIPQHSLISLGPGLSTSWDICHASFAAIIGWLSAKCTAPGGASGSLTWLMKSSIWINLDNMLWNLSNLSIPSWSELNA